MDLSYEHLAEFFKGLAHPTRLQILDLLREGEMWVCHIEAVLNKRQAYVSQQLMMLREAGLVECRQDGLKVYYRLSHLHLNDVLSLMLGTIRQPSVQPVKDCPCPASSVILPSQIE